MPEPEAPASVETQLAVIRVELGFIKDHIVNGHADHEKRLRGLEQFKWVLVGLALASGGVAQAVATYVN